MTKDNKLKRRWRSGKWKHYSNIKKLCGCSIGLFSGIPCKFLNCIGFHDLNSFYRQNECNLLSTGAYLWGEYLSVFLFRIFGILRTREKTTFFFFFFPCYFVSLTRCLLGKELRCFSNFLCNQAAVYRPV